jgi:hypothetical protein
MKAEKIAMKNEIENTGNGDLYALLALCTREDLDPLVTTVLSKFSNYLDIDKDYKRFKPDHTKYHKVIGDEIRLFGGTPSATCFEARGRPTQRSSSTSVKS